MRLLYFFVRQFLGLLEPLRAHSCVIRLLRFANHFLWVSRRTSRDNPILACSLWGLNFSNPVGLSAGLDKNAEAIDVLFRLGFGFVEIGAITREKNDGKNPIELFRLKEDRALINRFGFPNDGLEIISKRLERRSKLRHRNAGILGANIGFVDGAKDPISDYIICVERLVKFVDYIVLNISCPNTENLRKFQKRENLEKLIPAAQTARNRVCKNKFLPILLKIDPDIDSDQKKGIAEAALKFNVDGLIIGNTTTGYRKQLISNYRNETGGLSGRPLFGPSTKLVREMYDATDGKIPIIGIGGIENSEDAYKKIRAGASLVAIYTALVYEGPSIIREIKSGLVSLLRQDGFKSIQEAVGADAREAGSKEKFEDFKEQVEGDVTSTKAQKYHLDLTG